MFFIVNEDYKIILGWSAKCGCSHIKNIYNFIRYGYTHENEIHKKEYYSLLSKKVLDNINDYRIFYLLEILIKELFLDF
jgi:hypothetical protein